MSWINNWESTLTILPFTPLSSFALFPFPLLETSWNMGANDVPVDKAELLSTLLEGILYGCSLLMFGATIWVLFYRRSTQKVNHKMLAAACSLLLCSTAHLVIDIIRITYGLISDRDGPGGPIAFFLSVSHWTFVSKTYLYVIQTLIGDGVILYRCSVLWQSKRVMIIPAFLWCATGVTGIGSAYAGSHLANSDIFCEILTAWINAFYATAFSTNVLTTSLLALLAYRIWYFDRRASCLRGHSLMRETLHTILDAGAIYFVALLALMICFSLRSNSQFVVLDMIVPIISITFYMVIIRVGFSNRENEPTIDDISSCVEARDVLQVHHMTLAGNALDIRQRSPSMGSMVVIDNESCRAQNDIKFDDTREGV